MACWSGFGDLLDGEHGIWAGDFTAGGQAQVMFYYAGDGNWWLGNRFFGFGHLQWRSHSNPGRAYQRRIRVLVKVVQTPNVAIATMIANMQQVYDRADILIEQGPQENLTVLAAPGTAPQLVFNVVLAGVARS